MNKSKLDILIESEVKPPKLTQKQKSWLNNCTSENKGDWKYENGVVNVKGQFYCDFNNLTTIPVQFGKISGTFWCCNNKLTSLKGCPHLVWEEFYCDSNELISLEFIPKVLGHIRCHDNHFILNDKLFEDIRGIGGEKKIYEYKRLMLQLYNQIPTQFGITDPIVINEIWRSYMNILEGK